MNWNIWSSRITYFVFPLTESNIIYGIYVHMRLQNFVIVFYSNYEYIIIIMIVSIIMNTNLITTSITSMLSHFLLSCILKLFLTVLDCGLQRIAKNYHEQCVYILRYVSKCCWNLWCMFTSRGLIFASQSMLCEALPLCLSSFYDYSSGVIQTI